MTEIDDTSEKSLPPNPPPVNPPEVDHQKSNSLTFGNLPIEGQLTIGKRALENTTTNPLIGDVMARFGFDKEKMSYFRTLYEEAVAAYSQQIKEYGDKAVAYADFSNRFEIAKADFSTLRKFARVALKKEKDKLATITAADRKKETISGLLNQMQACYTNIFNDKVILQKLALFGITEETLNDYRKNFEIANNSYAILHKEDGEAIEATRIRDEKIDALCDFLSDFFAVAKVVFAKQPGLLVQIT